MFKKKNYLRWHCILKEYQLHLLAAALANQGFPVYTATQVLYEQQPCLTTCVQPCMLRAPESFNYMSSPSLTAQMNTGDVQRTFSLPEKTAPRRSSTWGAGPPVTVLGRGWGDIGAEARPLAVTWDPPPRPKKPDCRPACCGETELPGGCASPRVWRHCHTPARRAASAPRGDRHAAPALLLLRRWMVWASAVSRERKISAATTERCNAGLAAGRDGPAITGGSAAAPSGYVFCHGGFAAFREELFSFFTSEGLQTLELGPSSASTTLEPSPFPLVDVQLDMKQLYLGTSGTANCRNVICVCR